MRTGSEKSDEPKEVEVFKLGSLYISKKDYNADKLSHICLCHVVMSGHALSNIHNGQYSFSEVYLDPNDWYDVTDMFTLVRDLPFYAQLYSVPVL